MNIESPVIPYNFSDLEPAMSRDTVVLHFASPARVLRPLCWMVRGTQLEELPLEELIRVTERNPAQHDVYRDRRRGVESQPLLALDASARRRRRPTGWWRSCCVRASARYEPSCASSSETAAAHFGSGWLCVVWRGGTVRIVTTSNAGTPLVRGDSRCSRWTCGSTPTTSITRTAAAPTSARSSRSWSTGTCANARSGETRQRRRARPAPRKARHARRRRGCACRRARMPCGRAPLNARCA